MNGFNCIIAWTWGGNSAKSDYKEFVRCFEELRMVRKNYRPGDWVVYCKTKFSAHPGERARNVQPTPHGDDYCYTVDKFWVVDEVGEDGTVWLRTPRGKRYSVRPNCLHLRRPSLFECLWYRARFLECQAGEIHDAATASTVGGN